MLGSIAGDIIGSRFEGYPTKSTEFELFHERSSFTDDTVLTVAVADALLHDGDYVQIFRRYGRAHPDRGYGNTFSQWLANDAGTPYHSWGNGSAMRVSPVGFAFDSIDAVLREAERSAAVTHNHPEGIKGAQAVALSIFLARRGAGKDEVRTEVARRFGYDLERQRHDGLHRRWDRAGALRKTARGDHYRRAQAPPRRLPRHHRRIRTPVRRGLKPPCFRRRSNAVPVS
jgi:ADP-ribosylglycohydrolase